jgi:hypothetical protein
MFCIYSLLIPLLLLLLLLLSAVLHLLSHSDGPLDGTSQLP